MKTFTDDGCFRYRLICSTLSGQPVQFENVRASASPPGLLEEEAAFLRLLNAISHGCVVEIDPKGKEADSILKQHLPAGTRCLYKPGLVIGGHVDFDVDLKRSLSYFLEPLILLGLFGKKELSMTLDGITHDNVDPSVDILRTVTLPTVAKFCDIEDGLELKVIRRGAAPLGGGKVHLTVHVIKQVPSNKWTDEGMVKRIRGVAYSLKVSPQFANRTVDSARGLLNPYLSDVHIFTDAVRGKDSGNSPGYGMHLVAETTTGRLLSSEGNADKVIDGLSTPETVGAFTAALLLEEIQRGGVVDGMHQRILLFLCAMGPELISQVRLGPLVPQTVEIMRLLNDFFGVRFDVRPESEHGTVFLSCIGVGMKNMARKTG